MQTLAPLAILATLRQRSSSSSGDDRPSVPYLLLAAVTAAVILPLPISSVTQAALASFFLLTVSLAYAQLEDVLGAHRHGNELLVLDEKQTFSPANDCTDLVIRDVAMGMGTVCLFGTCFFESARSIEWNSTVAWAHLLLAITLNAFAIVFTILMVSSEFYYVMTQLIGDEIRTMGAVRTSLVPSAAMVLARMSIGMRRLDMVFGAVSLLGTVCSSSSLLSEVGFEPSKITRLRGMVVTAAAFCFSGLAVVAFFTQRTRALQSFSGLVNTMMVPLDAAWQPMELVDRTVHPIEYLSSTAQAEHDRTMHRQSSNLIQSTALYKARYGLAPPPLFDKWYEFAQARDIHLIDEFDTIHDAMLPFWALKPATLRARVTEALGYEENGLIALMIRNGKVQKVEGGEVWQQESLAELVDSFVHLLPDLDVAFNQHDEPRIIVPHDELSRMVSYAKDSVLPRSLSKTSHTNEFSLRPKDMSPDARIPEVKVSRFNEYAHQNTWIPSRLSCSPDSPARDFQNIDDVSPVADNTTSYALTGLGFIYNLTASTDVCTSPTLKLTHGFFDRPNAFKVAHELIPIFSESKVSSFQDILFPSMWHWSRKLPVDRTATMHEPGMAKDMYHPSDNKLSWEEKNNSLWWRGSTTGGYSKNGAWRHHHRQRLVRAINAPERVKILLPQGTLFDSLSHSASASHDTHLNDTSLPLQATTVPHAAVAPLFDVAFSGVGQCSPADCHAQEEFFNIAPHVPMAEGWRYRHLLDMDGNAFSARFYALLQSGGLVHKMQVFREWHDEWVRPWVHYVPLSLTGGEWAESLRFLTHEDGEGGLGTGRGEGRAHGNGERIARGIAERGQTWVEEGGGRREAMEAWMFRLLLEYARVVDDRREDIGYDG